MITSGDDIQLENGNWSRVHNAILELLAKLPITGREAGCLFFLLRMTYGNRTGSHTISLSLWEQGTGINRRHIKPILDKLIERKIITRAEGRLGNGGSAIYGFNKHFEQWDKASKERHNVLSKAPSTVLLNEPDDLPEVPSTVLLDAAIEDSKVPFTVLSKVPSTVPITEKESSSSYSVDDHINGNGKKPAATAKPSINSKPQISEFAKAYQEIWGRPIESAMRGEQIADWEGRVTLEMWRYALTDSIDKRYWKYLEVILNRLEREGLPASALHQQAGAQQPAVLNFILEDI